VAMELMTVVVLFCFPQIITWLPDTMMSR